MGFIQDLTQKDGWRKFTYAVLLTLLSWVAMMCDQMNGSTFATLAGSTMAFLSAAEVLSQAVNQKAATKQAQAGGTSVGG